MGHRHGLQPRQQGYKVQETILLTGYVGRRFSSLPSAFLQEIPGHFKLNRNFPLNCPTHITETNKLRERHASDLTDDYLIRMGDQANIDRYLCEHKRCRLQRLDRQNEAEYCEIFEAAGFDP